MGIENDEIYSAVVKRARGYSACETVEEYAMIDGVLELVKKRVTVKDVPPDMTAAKMIFDGGRADGLSDEELERERVRLLKELAELDSRGKAVDMRPNNGRKGGANGDS